MFSELCTCSSESFCEIGFQVKSSIIGRISVHLHLATLGFWTCFPRGRLLLKPPKSVHTMTPYVTVPFLGIDELPLRVGGTRPRDYDFSVQKTWMRAKPEASRGPDDYVALINRVDAAPVWGSRVRLSGWLETKGVVGSAWGGLFVRVDSADGTVLAFDNMRLRPIRGALAKQDYYDVVLDVPGSRPSDGTQCADPATLPVDIWVGVFLCGGQGMLWIDSLHFDVVGPEVRVTASSPPWTGPGDPF